MSDKPDHTHKIADAHSALAEALRAHLGERFKSPELLAPAIVNAIDELITARIKAALDER